MSNIKKKKNDNIALSSNSNLNIRPSTAPKTTASNLSSVDAPLFTNPIKKKVQFESSIFLDQLFKRALKLAINQQTNAKFHLEKKYKISIGIDIVCYGAFNSKMAFLITNEKDPTNISVGSIEMCEDHVGCLKVLPNYSKKDICFIEQFQSIIRATFNCFGKRWYELKDDEMKTSKKSTFKIVEQNQFPCIYFDESRCYTTNEIVSKYLETLLRCLNIDLNDSESKGKLKGICVTIPSDFHSYQRLVLKNCFENIGLKKFILVNKSTSLALPFLAKNLSDSSKKFILDFGSGKNLPNFFTKRIMLFNRSF
jgi:hypothetical protein